MSSATVPIGDPNEQSSDQPDVHTTAGKLADLYRRNDEWRFRVLGQGYAKGIAAIAADYGLNL